MKRKSNLLETRYMRNDQNEYSGTQLQGVPSVHVLSAERSSPRLKVWSFTKQFAMLVFIYFLLHVQLLLLNSFCHGETFS